MEQLKFNSFQIICGIVNVLIYCNGIESVEYLREKPSFLQACQMNEPSFKKCIKENTQLLVHKLVTGDIQELTASSTSFEPIYLDIFTYDVANSMVNLKSNITEIFVRGVSNIVVKDLKVSKKDLSWATKLFTPLLRIEFNYSLEGRLMSIPIKKADYIILEFENLELPMKIKTDLVEKDGLTFFDVENLKLELKSKHIKSNKKNFYTGVGSKSEASFDVEPIIYGLGIRPVMTKLLEKLFFDRVKQIFDFIPANFLIADIPKPVEFYSKNN